VFPERRARAGGSPARQRVEGDLFRHRPSRLWIAFRYLDDFVGAIRHAVACVGDADTLAAIVGGVGAAREALDAIPPGWRDVVEPLPIKF
jgi:hypothetical protein